MQEGRQWLSFIDPKGLRQRSLSDPKLGLYKEVKVIEKKLADPERDRVYCIRSLYTWLHDISTHIAITSGLISFSPPFSMV